jgi:GH15 family glucan-1,4-alpha-glucosidase
MGFRTEFVVRFNYGATVPWVSRLDDGALSAIAGPERLVLRSPAALRAEDLTTIGEFTIEAGQSIPFVLSHGASFQDPPAGVEALDALQRTQTFWREWSDRCPEVGPWTETIKRSLITLKALTYAPTGGVVAAATTSLPEQLGGVRNWDYRYCWLRDATFTLLALMHLGYHDEGRAWRDWLIRAVAGSPEQVQIMYGVGGERWLPESIVPWLPGYENSSPVRIGNAAYEQLQIDVFGEVIDAMFQARKAGMPRSERGEALRPIVMDYLAKAWRQPDEGIWEVRGGRQDFVHSKVMAWVAFDRAATESEGTESGRRWRAGDPAGRLSSRVRPAGPRHASSDRGQAADRSRIRAALRTGKSRRRPASGRRRFPGVQLFAGQQLHITGPLRGSAQAVRPLACALQ